MIRSLIVWGAVFGLTGVILGALGAHALKAVLNADQLASFNTGVRYQMFHALVLLILGTKLGTIEAKVRFRIGLLFIAGVILFSGSIYCLATIPAHGLEGIKWMGPITPIGGLLMIIAWLWILIAAIRTKV